MSAPTATPPARATRPPAAGRPAGTLAAAVLVAFTAAGAPLAAQVDEAEGGAGATLQAFRFSDESSLGLRSLSLFTLPVAARVSVARQMEIRVRGGWARGSLGRDDGSTATVAGLTDTELQLSVPVGGDVLVLSGLVVLPTGHATHTDEEAAVAGAVAADLLPFRITNWGTGGGAGGSAAVSVPAGAFGLGASLGYVVAREFEPSQDAPFAYRPGNMLRANVVVDRSLGAAGKGSIRASLQRFSDDATNGTDLYRSGNRYEVLASYAFAAGARASAIVYAGLLHREQGTFLGASATAPSQDLVVVGGGARLPAGAGVLVPDADVRLFRREDGVGQGWIGGAGLGVEWPAGGAVLVPSVKLRFGSVEIFQGRESTFTGFEAGLTARARRVAPW